MIVPKNLENMRKTGNFRGSGLYKYFLEVIYLLFYINHVAWNYCTKYN